MGLNTTKCIISPVILSFSKPIKNYKISSNNTCTKFGHSTCQSNLIDLKPTYFYIFRTWGTIYCPSFLVHWRFNSWFTYNDLLWYWSHSTSL